MPPLRRSSRGKTSSQPVSSAPLEKSKNTRKETKKSSKAKAVKPAAATTKLSSTFSADHGRVVQGIASPNVVSKKAQFVWFYPRPPVNGAFCAERLSVRTHGDIYHWQLIMTYRQSPRHHAHPGRVPGASEAPHNFNLISPTPSGALESSVTTQRRARPYAASWNEPRLVTRSFRSRRVEVKNGGDGARKEGGGRRKEGGGTRPARGVERCGGLEQSVLDCASFRSWGGEVSARHAMVKRSGGGRGKERADRDEDTTRPEGGWCRTQTRGKKAPMSSDQRVVVVTETQSALGEERRNVRVSGADECVVAVAKAQGVEEAARRRFSSCGHRRSVWRWGVNARRMGPLKASDHSRLSDHEARRGETQSSDREVRHLSEADVVRNHASRDNDFVGKVDGVGGPLHDPGQRQGRAGRLGGGRGGLIEAHMCTVPETGMRKGDSGVQFRSSLKGGVGGLLLKGAA
ncbi:hypothetical protein DFH08DRAFT_816461 [Mycena albidolilacea]|uniref:Uncharacterized protein n=1 Tax=Mycena albidolilacea TaxID=1033008 RepID=A0AAD6ZKI0_9AGAR|nr:hypothetical protein DFH08DRAFT_816461 [Mycena albidolilacea]